MPIPGAFERDYTTICQLASNISALLQTIRYAAEKDKQRLRDRLAGQIKDYVAAVNELAGE